RVEGAVGSIWNLWIFEQIRCYTYPFGLQFKKNRKVFITSITYGYYEGKQYMGALRAAEEKEEEIAYNAGWDE
ncbi:MAG: hypothetical protein KAT65_18325, partial [Methanophagales archaeon]|nr:hypothetical protein [Methanophagales archaeon]